MVNKQYDVYIMANQHNTVLYIGVTSDLRGRVWEHRSGSVRGFTSKYNVKKLVYYDTYHDPDSAIAREKQLKAGSRAKKVALIVQQNPGWIDLYDTL